MITRRVEPTEEQLKAGQVKEVDVRLGNFEVHLFDASIKPREVDPHHTLTIPWQEQEKALKALKDIGANIEKVRPHRDSPNYSINVFDPDGNAGYRLHSELCLKYKSATTILACAELGSIRGPPDDLRLRFALAKLQSRTNCRLSAVLGFLST